MNPPAAAAAASFVFTTPAAAPVGSQITVTGLATDTSENVGLTLPTVLTLVNPGGEVVGTVRNVQNQPVAGALVTVTGVNGVFAGVADALGFYRIGVVQPGPVSVTAARPCHGAAGTAHRHPWSLRPGTGPGRPG